MKRPRKQVQQYFHTWDKYFCKGMESRYNDYKSGKIKLVSMEEVEQSARMAAEIMRARKAG